MVFTKYVTILALLLITTTTLTLGLATQNSILAQTTNIKNHGIAGDWDTNSNCLATSKLMSSKGVTSIIGLGDYGYDSSASTWWNKCFFEGGNPVFKSGVTIMGAIGNHDSQTDYVKLFNMQSSVTFRIVDKHYQIFMNTNDGYGKGSSQYNAVIAMLNDAKIKKASGEVNWISVSFHKPVYASSSSHSPLTDIRTTYQDLWETADVDFVFQGHNHNYERSYPITWSGSNYQILTKDTTNYLDLDDKDGIIYFVVGTGGRGAYSLSSAPDYIVGSERTNPVGYLNMGIDNTNGLVNFKMFKTDGKVVSDFTVKRTLGASTTEPTPTPITPAPTPIPAPTVSSFDKLKALNFIKSMYDPKDGMLKECPSCPKKWLWSDQLVGQIMLKHIDPTMAQNIENKMNSYGILMKNPWATFDPQYRQFFSVKQTTELPVSSGSYVWYSNYGGNTDLPCNQYADVAFLKAIHLFNTEQLAAAKTCYDAGKTFWDGKGMKDAGQITGEYAVYKTALGLLAQKITGFEPIGIPANYFDRFQATNGGVITDLTGGQPQGSQNIETTFAVLAALDPSLLLPPTSMPAPTPTPTPVPIPAPTPAPAPVEDIHQTIKKNTETIIGLLNR